MKNEPETGRRRALARKYRPSALSELVGQEGTARALSRAIETGHVANAYLLTGVRGTGKTSTARIIAAGLNCDHGPTPAPCGRCRHCRAIAEDRHLDVQETDAASRTSVDGVREMIDGVPYAPVEGRTKVFIVDEVHMLSRAAFNALLKTLEEPPDHVVFVLATTEVRKIPATVVSRCQRFDMRRVPPDALAEHYAEICRRESIDADRDALRVVARAADGSVRDGLSVLDQAAARSGGTVDAETVRDMLGIAEAAAATRVLDMATSGDPGGAARTVRDLVSHGTDPSAMLGDLLARIHDAAVAAADPDAGIDPALSQEEAETVRTLASRLGVRGAHDAWMRAVRGLDLMRGPDPERALEMTVLSLSEAVHS